MAITERDITIYGHGGGRPSKKNLYTYTAQRYANKAPNGLHKGIVAVKRLKGINEDNKKAFELCYRTILGRNIYSQAKRGYVYKKYKDGKYYSDCSSSGMATLKQIGIWDGDLLNTAGIYNSRKFETVKVKIKDGHITNPEVLEVGDAILYIGNDPKRPKQIGHVEWVADTPKHDEAADKNKKTYTGKFPVLDNGRDDGTGHGYYKKGDGKKTLINYPTQIKRIQLLINWIDDDTPDIAVDGYYGAKTVAKVKAAQKVLGISKSGVFDYKTLSYAKKYEKSGK